MRVLIPFYATLLVFLAGFLAAGATAGAVLPVVAGTAGLLGFLGATVARIAAQAPAAARRTGSVRGSG
jgi:hypothetical protein